MMTIVAGTLRHVDDAQPIIGVLQARGIPEARYQVFHVNSPGQHAALGTGGDVDKDSGARNAGTGAGVGALSGGAIGAVAGAVGGPVGAVVGAGVGAYVGSLGGALFASEDGDVTGSNAQGAAPEDRAPRRGGVLLAVHVMDDKERADAIAALRKGGALDIESAEGEWRDRDWVDFDPTKTPDRVGNAEGLQYKQPDV